MKSDPIAKCRDARLAVISRYKPADEVLGLDFITPEEIATIPGLAYTPQQLARYSVNLPNKETLMWCKAKGMLLLPSSPRAVSLLEVREMKPEYFFSRGPDNGGAGWFDDEKEKFARASLPTLSWIAFPKQPQPDSLNKMWKDQQGLVKNPMQIASAGWVAWVLTIYKAVRQDNIYVTTDVRTTSVSSSGNPVYVGSFNWEGLYIGDCPGYRPFPNLGIAEIRVF